MFHASRVSEIIQMLHEHQVREGRPDPNFVFLHAEELVHAADRARRGY